MRHTDILPNDTFLAMLALAFKRSDDNGWIEHNAANKFHRVSVPPAKAAPETSGGRITGQRQAIRQFIKHDKREQSICSTNKWCP